MSATLSAFKFDGTGINNLPITLTGIVTISGTTTVSGGVYVKGNLTLNSKNLKFKRNSGEPIRMAVHNTRSTNITVTAGAADTTVGTATYTPLFIDSWVLAQGYGTYTIAGSGESGTAYLRMKYGTISDRTTHKSASGSGGGGTRSGSFFPISLRIASGSTSQISVTYVCNLQNWANDAFTFTRIFTVFTEYAGSDGGVF